MSKIKRSSFKDRAEMVAILRMLYETTFGIYDHMAAASVPGESALALHFAKPNEDTSYISKEAINHYVDNSIKTVFGCSLNEFLAMPTQMRLFMIEAAVRKNKKHNALADELTAQLEGDK